MPFWAFYMIACAALILLGWRGNAWKAPAAILAGLFGVRLTPFLPDVFHEIGSFTVWLIVTYVLAYNKHYVTSVLIGLSALAYSLLIVGFRIEYLGLMPIVSDAFLIFAIGASGGGIYRKCVGFFRRLGGRSDMVVSFSQDLAKSKGADPKISGGA